MIINHQNHSFNRSTFDLILRFIDTSLKTRFFTKNLSFTKQFKSMLNNRIRFPLTNLQPLTVLILSLTNSNRVFNPMILLNRRRIRVIKLWHGCLCFYNQFMILQVCLDAFIFVTNATGFFDHVFGVGVCFVGWFSYLFWKFKVAFFYQVNAGVGVGFTD